ncbi:class I SAM-dependent methyltransferase [Prauserella marina]|uniref:class I SAM-dependent methyltransferase n=1 Tax=Prauserella marina TaxID=530584 RepID=UPI000B827F9E|nr:class I SAM-dependent methyltransferase [Prauserella marina]
MSAHTHDDIDWGARLKAMRRLDLLERDVLASVASRLTSDLPEQPTVVDVGSGSGGMSAAIAAELQQRGGGVLVLVDAVDELLVAAHEAAAVAGGPTVRVQTITVDVGAEELRALAPSADLIWASAVIHHLPDQQGAIDRLAAGLRSGGVLAVAEGGLDPRCLPWDLGVGEPGLELRLNAVRDRWFEQLRATMPEVVSMPYGWTTALRRAELRDVNAFSYLLDWPAPTNPTVREYVLERIEWLAEMAADHISEPDRDTLRRVLDPQAPEFLGARDDLYVLMARTVFLGRRA